MITTIIFALSLLVSLALISFKALELKRNKKNIALRLISRFDSISARLVSAFKFKALQLIQSVRYIVIIQSKIVFRAFLHKATERALNEYHTRYDIILGHKEISNKGSVSFYLKKIAENKDSGEKGKIEDSL